MSDKIGLFTGSFDPMTLGHLDLIERASGPVIPATWEAEVGGLLEVRSLRSGDPPALASQSSGITGMSCVQPACSPSTLGG